jgi:hypothetical protein
LHSINNGKNQLELPEIIGNNFIDKISTITDRIKANLVFENCEKEIPRVDFYIVERQMKDNAIIVMDVLQNFKTDSRNENIEVLNNILYKKDTEISTTVFNME